VEPYEPKQPVVTNASEQIGDLCWLTCGTHCPRPGNEYRVTGQLAHGRDGRAEQGSELPGRLEVVTVDPYPVHVGTARPPLGRSRDATAMGVVDDVDRPQPGDILGSERAECGDEVAPGSHEHRRGRFPVPPGVPVAVHLVTEAQDDRVAVGTDSLSVSAQVAVVPSGSDRGNADAVRVHLHKRHRTVIGRGRGKPDWEGYIPSAIVHNHIWPSPGSVPERGHPGVRG